MRFLGGIQICVFLASFVACRGQDKARDEAAIRQFVDEFARAENSRDGEKLSKLFTADGEAVVQNGAVAYGRDAIKKSVTPRMPWSEIGPATYKVQRIKFVHPDVAVVDAQRTVFTSTLIRSSATAFILAKESAGWRVASYRSASETQPPLPDSPFASPDPKQ